MNILNSEYIIMETIFSDTEACVIVMETIIYGNDVETKTEDVKHKILLMKNSSQKWRVLSDDYCEEITEFISSSYVPEIMTFAMTRSTTYSLAIVNIAVRESGYREKATNANLNDKMANAGTANYTKYGEWYGLNPEQWCAMFVSWCANQAGISTSIVPKFADCDVGRVYFQNNKLFFFRGEQEPQEGDIFFKGDNINDATHVGIVVAVEGEYMHIVHGNTFIDGTEVEGVWDEWVKKTDTRYIGFARPSYPVTHSYVLRYNVSYHWQQCTKCNDVILRSVHTYSAYGRCTVCGATQATMARVAKNDYIE